MNAPLLLVEGLSKTFGGVHAVNDVSFTLERGSLLAMIGPNGAGKSTCFNMLGGQVGPDRGRIRVEGRDIVGKTSRDIGRLGVGRTFQTAATFASMSLRENVQVALGVACGTSWRPLGRLHSDDRADQLLALVGLEGRAEQPCAALAYGDTKRLDVALALAGDPSLLLMDEPTAGMAAGERAELMRLVVRIAREQEVGVLFTEHDLGAVFDAADAVLVLDRGRAVAIGTTSEIRRNEEVRRVYLGEG